MLKTSALRNFNGAELLNPANPCPIDEKPTITELRVDLAYLACNGLPFAAYRHVDECLTDGQWRYAIRLLYSQRDSLSYLQWSKLFALIANIRDHFA